jgi:hypothetical protein
MGYSLQPMLCPKCNRITLEDINYSVGVNSTFCLCGYSYLDDVHGEYDSTKREVTKEAIDEF